MIKSLISSTLVRLDKDCTAKNMCSGIVIIFKDKGHLISDVIGLYTEGASTTTGCRRRFAPLFKNENSFIISEHCACNRLAFTSVSSSKFSSIFDKTADNN